MPRFDFKKLAWLVLIALLLNWFYSPSQVKALVSSCNANVDLHSVTPSTTSDFGLTLDNTDANTIRWIRVTRPSTQFTIGGYSIGGWAGGWTNNEVTFGGGSLGPGESLNFSVQATSGSSQAAAADWVVQVSDDAGGTNPFNCSGVLDTEIQGTAPDTTAPTISNITMSGLTSTSITIVWTTDEPATSNIYYGLDDSYGSEKSDLTLKTSHSVVLTGLTADTGYHFQIESVDGVGNASQSEDNTFLTPVLGQSEFTSNTGTSSPNGSSPSEVGLKKVNLKATEKIPPTIAISTDLSKPFTLAPTIVGAAADNSGVYSIEYSTDGGKNWLRADKQTGLGGKNVNFEFKPLNLDDGNYKIVARVTDTSGNQASSQTYTLVIDRLPPTVGGSVISIGPQILKPDKNGIVTSVLGIDQKVTLASVGGATQISIRSVDDSSKTNKEGQIFTLSRSSQTGLWSGILSFSKKGVHNLTVQALDGAGNQTKRDFGKIYALSGGQIIEKESHKPINSAKITLFYLEGESNSWVVWDGSSYGQKNPQQTNKDGQFRLFAPTGKYYLEVSAQGYKTVISKIFEVNQTTPLVQNISLEKAIKIGFGMFSFTLPSLTIEKVAISQNQKKVNLPKPAQGLENKNLPNFNLEKTSGGTTNHVQLSGKPTLISFVSTWSPSSQEQFQVLEKLQNNQDLNIAPVAVLESGAKLVAYQAISKLRLDFLVDPDGTTVSSFGYQSLPTHYFVNRKGIIKKITIGVLSEKEILDNLGGM